MDTLLANGSLKSGEWRASDATTDILACSWINNRTPCAGGPSAGLYGVDYCARNHTGALCEACDSGMYFDKDDASCNQCPSTEEAVWVAAAWVFPLIIVLTLMTWLWTQPPTECCKKYVSKAKHVARRASGIGLMATFKITFNFVQIVMRIPDVYEVSLPEAYRSAYRAAREALTLDFDYWLTPPAACIGGFRTTLLVTTVAPLVLIAFVLFCGWLWTVTVHYYRKRPGSPPHVEGLLRGAPLSLMVIYLVTPTVSFEIFSAFNCRPYGYNDTSGEEIHFMLNDPSIRCWGSDQHNDILAIAIGMIVVWPVGVVLGFAILLSRCRKAFHERKPSSLSRATAFLHREYEVPFYYWEVVTMVQRILLCGALLCIPDQNAQLRLQSALLLSVVFLVVIMLAMPFFRLLHDYLALIANFTLVCIFLGATSVNLYEDMAKYLPTETVGQILGLDSPDVYLTCMLVFTLAVISIAVFALLQQLATQRSQAVLVSERTGLRPTLLLREGEFYHMFLSHIWSSGQDQVALIKKLMQQLVPGVRVFLDVDDLEDIGKLEEYIEESSSVLIFLSQGYFSSSNCLREVYHAVHLNKPLILVREPNPMRGGVALQVARSEMPRDLRESIFGLREASTLSPRDSRVSETPSDVDPGCRFRDRVIDWQRIREFQTEAMRLIATKMLNNLPHASRTTSQPQRRGTPKMLRGLARRKTSLPRDNAWNISPPKTPPRRHVRGSTGQDSTEGGRVSEDEHLAEITEEMVFEQYCLPDEIRRQHLTMPVPLYLYASANNPGALLAAQEAAELAVGVKVVEEPPWEGNDDGNGLTPSRRRLRRTIAQWAFDSRRTSHNSMMGRQNGSGHSIGTDNAQSPNRPERRPSDISISEEASSQIGHSVSEVDRGSSAESSFVTPNHRPTQAMESSSQPGFRTTDDPRFNPDVSRARARHDIATVTSTVPPPTLPPSLDTGDEELSPGDGQTGGHMSGPMPTDGPSERPAEGSPTEQEEGVLQRFSRITNVVRSRVSQERQGTPGSSTHQTVRTDPESPIKRLNRVGHLVRLKNKRRAPTGMLSGERDEAEPTWKREQEELAKNVESPRSLAISMSGSGAHSSPQKTRHASEENAPQLRFTSGNKGGDSSATLGQSREALQKYAMLLYLNWNTYADTHTNRTPMQRNAAPNRPSPPASAGRWEGDAGTRLADEVRAAMKAGIPLRMIHENDDSRDGCEFARFFITTPPDLVDDGLYKALAFSWMAPPYRQAQTHRTLLARVCVA